MNQILMGNMSLNDSLRIEQHTGQSAQELTDIELQKAMRDLNIQTQGMTHEDRSAEQQPQEWVAEEHSYLDELDRSGQLRDQGIITDKEFQAKKQELLVLQPYLINI